MGAKFIYHPALSHSGFLSYWYDNATSPLSLGAILNQKENELIGPQYDNFKKQRNAVKNSLIAAAGTDTEAATAMAQLFDIGSYDTDKLKEIMEPSLDGSNAIGVKLESLTDALSYLTEAKKEMDEMTTKMETFRKGIEEIINSLNPSGKYKGVITKIKKALLAKYEQQALNRGVISAANIKERSKVAQQLMLDILTTSGPNTIFDDLDIKQKRINNVEIDTTIKKLLLLAELLPDFDGDSISTVTVKHSSSPDQELDGDARAVVDALIGKVRGLTIALKGKTGEIAAAVGFLSAHVKDNNYAQFKNLKIEGHKVWGTGTCKIERHVGEGNHSFLSVLEEAKASLARVQNQVSKADVGFNVNMNGVEGKIGFSVKVGGKLNDPNYQGAANISIQSGTPLITLMGREMALSSDQIHGVMQLLASHGNSQKTSESELNENWEDLKEKLVQLAFVDALTGSALQGKAYFMIIGYSLFSVDYLIDEMMHNYNGNLSLKMSQSKTSTGSLERSDYLDLNKWKGSFAPNKILGDERGEQAWSSVSQLLYKTKIQISMNIASLGTLRGGM